MAYWGKKSLPYKKSPPELMKLGEGVNTYVNAFDITKNEATESLNTSDKYYPSLATRPGTEIALLSDFPSTTLTDVKGATFGGKNSNAFIVDNGTWKYLSGSSYITIATGLTNNAFNFANFLEFTTASDKYIVMFNKAEKKAYKQPLVSGSATVIDITDVNCPDDTNLITANDSRMFALKDSTISASDIGDITNWSTGDADKINLTGMVGEGTALIVYNDMIIAWSDQTMHVVFGKTKDDFDPTEPIPVGNVSQRSTMIHGQSGTLFWLSYGKVMAFTGGLPVEISQKVNTYLDKIYYDPNTAPPAMGQNGKYIYLSFQYKETPSSTVEYMTLEYNTERGTWYPRSNYYTDFYNAYNELYGVTRDPYVYKLNFGTIDKEDSFSAGETPITWSHTTGVFESAPLKNLKHITDMYAIVDLPTGSTLTLSFSTSIDNDDFQTLHTFTADVDEQNTRIRIPTTKLQRVNWYRLKFSGVGPARVHYLEVHGRRGE